jgi:hypothetical protein
LAKHDNRDFGHGQLSGGGQSAMTCNDGALLADQNRICESERLNAAGDLSDLRFAV